MVDLLLSLLALNVHLLRRVVRSVFSLLAPSLSAEAVMHVFQVRLCPSVCLRRTTDTATGQQAGDGMGQN